MSDEEGKDSRSIDTGGGASIGRDIDTGGGIFIGRDQIIIQGQTITPEELTRELEFRFLKIRNVSLSLGQLLLEKSPAKVVSKDAVRLQNHLAGKGGGGKRFEGEATEYLLSVFAGKIAALQFPREFVEFPAHQASFDKLKADHSVDLKAIQFHDFAYHLFDEVDLVLRWIEVQSESGKAVPVQLEGAKVLSAFSDACLKAFAFCKYLSIAFDLYHEWRVREC